MRLVLFGARIMGMLALLTAAGPIWADQAACNEALSTGNTTAETGDLGRAEAIYRAGIDAGAQELSSDQCLIDVHASLAALYAGQGRLAEEAEIIEARLALRRRVLGADDPDLMVEAHDLAGLYLELRQPALAAPYMEDVLAFDIVRFGPASPTVADAHFFIAILYEDAGDLPAASTFYGRALAIYLGFLPPCHADLARVQASYRGVLVQLGKAEKATAIAEQAQLDCPAP